MVSKTTKSTKTVKDLSADSSYGMATVVWGPLFWSLINDVAVIYDHHWKKWSSRDKDRMSIFWKILKHILPCRYCRESYLKYYHQSPPSYPFVKWVGILHNKVNAKLNKPLYDTSSFERKSQVYTSFSSSNTLTDIHFILALNYCSKTKQKYYQQWFDFLPLILPFLIREKRYQIETVQCYLTGPPPGTLSSKISLLTWLVRCQHTTRPVEYYILKYAKSIAHDTIEELALICGNLIMKTKNTKIQHLTQATSVRKKNEKKSSL